MSLTDSGPHPAVPAKGRTELGRVREEPLLEQTRTPSWTVLDLTANSQISKSVNDPGRITPPLRLSSFTHPASQDWWGKLNNITHVMV